MKQVIIVCMLVSVLPGCGGNRSLVPPKPPFIEKPNSPSTKKKLESISYNEHRIKELSYAELKNIQTEIKALTDKDVAIKYTEQLIAVSTDPEELHELRLSLADLYFDTGDLEKAAELYQDYANLYPSDVLIEYVSYKTILCNFYQTLDNTRDQSKTKETIKLSQNFLEAKNYTHYLADVRAIYKRCIKTLFESEVNVASFYLKNGKLPAAEQRIAYLKEQFARLLPSCEPAILALEYELAQKQGNASMAQEKQAELAALMQSGLPEQESPRSKQYSGLF